VTIHFSRWNFGFFHLNFHWLRKLHPRAGIFSAAQERQDGYEGQFPGDGKGKPRQPPVFKQFLTDNKRKNKKKDGNGKETGADGRMIAEHVIMIRFEQAMHRMSLLCTFQSLSGNLKQTNS
jgi:hypothetical protein